MDIHQYIEQKKKLQNSLHQFIEYEKNAEENYQNLIKLIEDQKTCQDPSELQAILYLIIKIANNLNRSADFFTKIEKIILYFKNDITKQFTNLQIFRIFKSNKRLLLFLFQEKLLIPEKSITILLQQKKYKKFNYISYLYNEIKTIIPSKSQSDEEKLKIGENDDFVCEMIRKDMIDEFISFSKKKIFQLKTTIETSIYETNQFLLKNNPTLIEYSAFFGSMQIFKYLNLNGVELKPSIWPYAIHGRNPEMIHYLEEKKIKPDDGSFRECLKESIKCHHNEITNYFLSNYFLNEKNFDVDFDVSLESIKYYNYEFINPNNLNNDSLFFQLCRNNYIYLVEFLLKTAKIDVNKKIV